MDYGKISKIGLFKYKPPKPVMQKNPPLNRPSKYKPPPGACTWKTAPEYKAKMVTLPPTIRGSPIDFETQTSLRR